VLEPESASMPAVKVPPITVIPPHNADAKPVPPSAIPPDIRKKIEESLASKPNVMSGQRTTLLVADTSEGMKTVKAEDNVDSAVDDAAEKVVRKSSQKKTGDKLLISGSKKQPAYLKSVVHSVVPSADPEAPYGRDENDRPILPGRTDQQLATDLSSKTFLKAGSCPHKSNPKYCLMCGTTNYKAAPVEPVDLEDQLRRLFGLTTDNIVVPAASVQPTDAEEQLRRQFGLSTSLNTTAVKKKFDYFPEILEITRGQLIGLLELAVGVEPRAIKKKVLKSRAVINSKIAELERTSARIAELKKLMAESEDIIHGLGKKIMDSRRAENPDDILDKPTRERFKREENKKIEKYEQEKRELQKLLHETDIEQLKQRVANWGSSPDDFEVMAATEDVTVKFEEKFKFGHEDSLPTHTIDGYVTLLGQYDLLKDVSRRLHRFPVLDEWRYFENEIVLQAIGFGLYRPTKQTFVEYPQLRKYLNGAPGDDSEDEAKRYRATEEDFIIKTGGAQIGGSIRSGGHRNGHQRPLESFDKRRPSGRPGEPQACGGDQPDNFYSGMDSGDLSERPGDE